MNTSGLRLFTKELKKSCNGCNSISAYGYCVVLMHLHLVHFTKLFRVPEKISSYFFINSVYLNFLNILFIFPSISFNISPISYYYYISFIYISNYSQICLSEKLFSYIVYIYKTVNLVNININCFLLYLVINFDFA